VSERVFLTERRHDDFGPDYDQVWMCEPPSMTAQFQVLDEEWNEDYTVRTIREIRV
jgi:hypothetical protein